MQERTGGGPICQKCNQPMVWHSDQAVLERGQQQIMHVFACESCERLQAEAGTSVRAA